MVKVKKSTNLNSTVPKVKKLNKKNKNVPKKNSEVKIETNENLKTNKKIKNTVSKSGITTPKTPKHSEGKVVKKEEIKKPIKKIKDAVLKSEIPNPKSPKLSEVKIVTNVDVKKPVKNVKKIKDIASKSTISIPKTPKSESESVQSEKKIKKIPKPYRNSVEATTASSRNKIVKKFKSPNNSENKPIFKKKLHKGDGDKTPKLADSEKNQKPKTYQKTKYGKKLKLQKKKVPKEGELVPSLEEAPPFDQEHFNSIIKQDKIKRIVQVLNKLVKNETGRLKNSIFSDYRYNLNVACFKIPSVPKRIVKLKVKHSIADEDTLLIVKDLQRGLKIDYEPTNQHYEDLLKENGVEGIKQVMSFNQLKTEYATFEMKNKLSNLFDYYLCDGAIVGHVVGFLGKIFSSKSRCTPYAVRMGNPKLVKTEINKALHKTCYKQGQKGNLTTIPVGTHKMTPGQVADNILHVIGQLKTIYPGGLSNIRNMTVGINLNGTSSLPIYINMGKPLEATPYTVGPRENKLNKLKEQANKILSQFEFTNEAGMVRLIKEENSENRKRSNGLDDDDNNDMLEEVIPKKKKLVKDSTKITEKSENDSENEDESNNDDEKINESDAEDDTDEGDSDDESNN